MNLPKDVAAFKREIVAALRENASLEIKEMTRIAREAAEAASHEENKPENDKDMRSTEASYIARGQAERARSLEHGLLVLSNMPLRVFEPDEAIQASALVQLSLGGTSTLLFLVSGGGGVRVNVRGIDIQSVLTTSPMGSALLGLSEGDEPEVRTPQGLKTYEIERVL
ncbi:MAG: GreA/GreB family elongation factor [Polyangiaceae bacterium]